MEALEYAHEVEILVFFMEFETRELNFRLINLIVTAE